MPTLPVQITRFVDEHQPGFVEFAFKDADGVARVFIDKVPVVTREDLGATSVYPCAGAIACEIVETWTDAVGRSLARIDTERPWHIETAFGETHFVVLAEQVSV